MADRPQLNPLLKLALDIGPLVLFFAFYSRWSFIAGTVAFMVATVAALAVSYVLTRHLPVMALVSLVIVLVFGGLTVFLQDEQFIKMKPTAVYLLFATVLGGGLILRKPLLAVVFDSMFHLTNEGWHKLTVRWTIFFLVLAIANEIIWRTQTTNVWFASKAVIVVLTFIFAAMQYPLLVRYDASANASPPDQSPTS